MRYDVIFASLCLWIGFESVVDHGADEGWELGVLLAFSRLRINRRLGIWVLATSVGQLGFVAAAEIL